MRLINQPFVFLSLIALSLSNLEAKSLEFVLDHTTQDTIALEVQIPEQRKEQSLYAQQLKIENIGNQPIKNCFPYVNNPPSLTLDSLAYQLTDKPYPLLALYELWKTSLVKNESALSFDGHPLDLLNFRGVCSEETFNIEFAKLCHALGFNIRLANIHGKNVYDFGIDEEWNLLDLTNEQIYLGINNEKLVSSEEIMDDPFLALRTKHYRHAKEIDFKENWKRLAQFEIIDAVSAMSVEFDLPSFKDRAQGLDLYPYETLTFETLQGLESDPNQSRCRIEHKLQLNAREVSSYWSYLSPFPIQQLKNESCVTLDLIDQKVVLQPGETFVFENSDLFEIKVHFSGQPKGQLAIAGYCSWKLFPHLKNGQNRLDLGAKENPSIVRFSYLVEEKQEATATPSLTILNADDCFSYQTPEFILKSSSEEIEKIWWQIALDPDFQLVPSNFDQVEPFSSLVTLPMISETFLNPHTSYYFRVKGYSKGQWSAWSKPFTFTVEKPISVEEVEFEQVKNNCYELNWERCAEDTEETIEYLVFGSNSLDFIPSIYCEKQVNAIVDGMITEEEKNDNLIAITNEPKILVNGGLAYYRIIARKNGTLSAPSAIIHVYDQDLIQPRNVLQVIEDDHHIFAKRTLFPASYPWTQTSLPQISAPRISTPLIFIPVSFSKRQDSLINLQLLLRSATQLEKQNYLYEFPDVSKDIWEEVHSYLLPPNHPAWPQLNRIFCQIRATLNPEQFKKAGFTRWRPGRWSRVSASSHPECKEYFIKAYCDCELGIIYDWRKWIHRIKGANSIRRCIKDYHLQDNFKVPHKWIYPLPKEPSPPRSSHYVRKNFILICENMRIQEHDKNEKSYKKKLTSELMDGIYTILQVCGLYDSVYVFNIPFCKDGRIAVIDTEYHHKWPVPFHKLTDKFPKNLQSHWKRITFNGGSIPDGVSQSNPPRMDRRDVIKKD